MNTDDTKQNKSDLLASSAKSLVGIVPFAGPLLSEIINNIIPNQRIDRLAKYINKFEERISLLESGKLECQLSDVECVDLIEEGFTQASRATTGGRIKYIANVVTNGLNDESIKYSESKYILKILEELNEQEIIWLRFYIDPRIQGDEDFREKHKNILNPIRLTFGSDEQEAKDAAFQSSYKSHLERLKLIYSKYRFDRKTGMPEYEKHSGKPKVTYTKATLLGKLVLRQIGYDPKEND